MSAWGLPAPSEHLTQREVVRRYESAIERLEEYAIERLMAMDMNGWEWGSWLAEKVRRAMENERDESPGWSVE